MLCWRFWGLISCCNATLSQPPQIGSTNRSQCESTIRGIFDYPKLPACGSFGHRDRQAARCAYSPRKHIHRRLANPARLTKRCRPCAETTRRHGARTIRRPEAHPEPTRPVFADVNSCSTPQRAHPLCRLYRSKMDLCSMHANSAELAFPQYGRAMDARHEHETGNDQHILHLGTHVWHL